MNVALGPPSAHGSYVRRSLTFLHHPGHKAWLASSLISQENVDHQESTSNRVSKPFGQRKNREVEELWTNVVTLCGLP
jgi:hypothetical protein